MDRTSTSSQRVAPRLRRWAFAAAGLAAAWVAGGALFEWVSITKPANSSTVGNPAIAVTLGADNRITPKFGNQTFAPIAIP